MDDVPMQLNKPRTKQGPHGVFTAKHAIYEKGKETQLEKELGAVAASAPTYRSYCALNARFLYRDTNCANRKSDPEVAQKFQRKPKRLRVSGQNDPDLQGESLHDGD